MYSTEPRKTIARTTAKSCALIASMVKLPSPGMPKKLSMIRLPRNSSGSTATVEVRIGSEALRSTWRNSTAVSDSPLARAVRT